jgi:hypothetical protein
MLAIATTAFSLASIDLVAFLATSPKGPWIDQSYGPSLGFAVNSLKEN